MVARTCLDSMILHEFRSSGSRSWRSKVLPSAVLFASRSPGLFSFRIFLCCRIMPLCAWSHEKDRITCRCTDRNSVRLDWLCISASARGRRDRLKSTSSKKEVILRVGASYQKRKILSCSIGKSLRVASSIVCSPAEPTLRAVFPRGIEPLCAWSRGGDQSQCSARDSDRFEGPFRTPPTAPAVVENRPSSLLNPITSPSNCKNNFGFEVLRWIPFDCQDVAVRDARELWLLSARCCEGARWDLLPFVPSPC